MLSPIWAFCPCTWVWHGFLLLYDNIGIDMKSICESEELGNDLQYLLCIWPSGALWWALLRDGLCFILAISLILIFQTRPTSPPLISAPFNGRPLNPPLILNARRDQMRPERRRRHRRSSFVIHYVLCRMGQIRRRKKQFLN